MFDEDEDDKMTIDEFYSNFPKYNFNPEVIKENLLKVDYDKIDKTELKEFLETRGVAYEEINSIIEDLRKKHLQNQNIQIIEGSISHYKNIGLDDKEIKDKFQKDGFDSELVASAFKEFYKKKIYHKYLEHITSHIKQLILSEKDDDEIIKTYEEHEWPEELVRDALNTAKKQIHEEESTMYLEKEILKRIIKGDNKEVFADAISRKRCPEKIIRKEFKNSVEGFKEFEKVLEELDLNSYNTEKIKKSLLDKNWPENIANIIIENLIDKIEFHRKLRNLEKSIHAKIDVGHFSVKENNSKKVRDELISEGWDTLVIRNLIDRINHNLIKSGNKDKIREFNSHIFDKDKYNNLKEIIKGFEISTISNGNNENLNYTQIIETQKTNKNG